MAILIVDDEAKTRESLRHLLTHLGHKVILEAKNGEDALRLADAERSRIHMFIVDFEMPYMDGLAFAQEISTRRYFDLAPFLLITSDLPRFQILEHKKKIPRLDHCLVKPFRLSGLHKAMVDAYAHRCFDRNRIFFLGENIPSSLVQLMNSGGTDLWSQILVLPSIKETKEFLADLSQKPGVILIEPSQLDSWNRNELSELLLAFKKTPLGTMTPLVCLSRNPSETFHFRTICQFFVNLPALYNDWKILLQRLEKQNLLGWELDLLFQKLKVSLHQKAFDSSRKLAWKILNLDENHCDAHSTLGYIFEELGNFSRAIEHYKRALDINPCLLRPYIKLLQLLSPSDPSSLAQIAEAGIQFCPHNPDLLLSAAKAFIQLKQPKNAKSLLETILSETPQHPLAEELLKSVPC